MCGRTPLCAALALLSSAASIPASAGVFFPYTKTQVARRSDVILVGRVADASRESAEIEVDDILKGSLNRKRVAVQPNTFRSCTGRDTLLQPGDRAVLFLVCPGGDTFYVFGYPDAAWAGVEKFVAKDRDAVVARTRQLMREAERQSGAAASGPARPAPGARPQCPLPGEWVVIEELTDEFEGDSLDETKWHPVNPQWKGRKPGFFARENVEVRGGALHLTSRLEDREGLPEGYHTFTTAAVKSRATVRYGYFEISAKPMDSRASSAFWFYRNTKELWTEIDVFEIGGAAPGHEHTVHMNAHVFHTPESRKHWSRGGKWGAPFRLAEAFHVYALEWDTKQLRYYVDGNLVREMENTHWHQALHMNFDSETMPKWFGLPKAENLPSTFSIEYVRSWRSAGEGAAPEEE